MKFFITENPDSDDKFSKTLLSAGYRRVYRSMDADFLLHDAIHEGPELDPALKSKKNFIFPHTPQSWFLWDGILEVKPTCCNFVYGEGAVRGMRAYGYPHRVEAVGFSRCNVREFTPTSGTDLLIVPAHPVIGGGYPTTSYVNLVVPLLKRVMVERAMFGKVTLCWNEPSLETSLVQKMSRKGITVIHTNPYKDLHPLQRMIERIEQADLVISCNTTGCVSVALGKPTIFFTETNRPRSTPKEAHNPGLYINDIRFPLRAEKMSIEDMLKVRRAPNAEAENWKRRNIGGPFQAGKFLSIIEECIR